MNWKDALEPGLEPISAPNTTLAPDEQQPKVINQTRDGDFNFGPDHESDDDFVCTGPRQPWHQISLFAVSFSMTNSYQEEYNILPTMSAMSLTGGADTYSGHFTHFLPDHDTKSDRTVPSTFNLKSDENHVPIHLRMASDNSQVKENSYTSTSGTSRSNPYETSSESNNKKVDPAPPQTEKTFIGYDNTGKAHIQHQATPSVVSNANVRPTNNSNWAKVSSLLLDYAEKNNINPNIVIGKSPAQEESSNNETSHSTGS